MDWMTFSSSITVGLKQKIRAIYYFFHRWHFLSVMLLESFVHKEGTEHEFMDCCTGPDQTNLVSMLIVR